VPGAAALSSGTADASPPAGERSPGPDEPGRAGLPGAPLPTAHGVPLLSATFGREPEDFRVQERLGLEPDGAGEHLWLHVEKRLLNTADVVALLEGVYGVGSADVGVSGLKDRRAVTRQWFSVRTGEDETSLENALTSGPLLEQIVSRAGTGTDDVVAGRSTLVVLDAARHSRKLRRGTHAANAFEITLRDVAAPYGPDTALDARLEALRTVGFPNYLGPQRFGRDGRNVERARAWFRAPRRRVTRLQRGLWLSAARSVLFNRVCALRVAEASWSTLLDGEPVSLDGSRAFFLPGARDDGDSLSERLARGDVHPSGPWWGRGALPALGHCAAFERDALADLGEFREGLERAGLDQERRALRARPAELDVDRLDGGDLRLRFTLAPGTFATTLLAELGSCTRETDR